MKEQTFASGLYQKVIDKNLRFGEIGDLMALEQTGTHKKHGMLMGMLIPDNMDGSFPKYEVLPE